MIKIVNNIIPLHGFAALTAWPFVFIRKEYVNELKKRGMLSTVLNHERVHGRQQVEMLVVGVAIAALMIAGGCGWWSMLALPIFWWWYCVEYVIRKVFGNGNAYRKISFEREAFVNEKDFGYIDDRMPFEWVKFLR